MNPPPVVDRPRLVRGLLRLGRAHILGEPLLPDLVRFAKGQEVKRGAGGALASARSKTGDPKCSSAVSEWRLGKATPETHKTLARCRAMASGKKAADIQRKAGNEAKAQHLEHRAAKGETQKARREKAQVISNLHKGVQIHAQGIERGGDREANQEHMARLREAIAKVRGKTLKPRGSIAEPPAPAAAGDDWLDLPGASPEQSAVWQQQEQAFQQGKTAPRPATTVTAPQGQLSQADRDAVRTRERELMAGAEAKRRGATAQQEARVAAQRQAPSPQSLAPQDFAARVHAALGRVGPEGRFGDKVFIHEAHKAAQQDPALAGMTLGQFQGKLLEANQARTLDLSRADLVEAMDPNQVAASGVQHPMTGATFNFIRSPAAPAAPAAPAPASSTPPGRLFGAPPRESGPAPSLTAPRPPVAPGTLAIPAARPDEGFARKGATGPANSGKRAQGGLFTGGSAVEQAATAAVPVRAPLPGQGNLLGGSPTPPASPASSARADSAPSAAVAALRQIQETATTLEPAHINASVAQSLAHLSGPQLRAVQKEYLGAAVGKNKAEILASLAQKIHEYRASQERVQEIVGQSAGRAVRSAPTTAAQDQARQTAMTQAAGRGDAAELPTARPVAASPSSPAVVVASARTIHDRLQAARPAEMARTPEARRVEGLRRDAMAQAQRIMQAGSGSFTADPQDHARLQRLVGEYDRAQAVGGAAPPASNAAKAAASIAALTGQTPGYQASAPPPASQTPALSVPGIESERERNRLAHQQADRQARDDAYAVAQLQTEQATGRPAILNPDQRARAAALLAAKQRFARSHGPQNHPIRLRRPVAV